jgi:formylglycine-generating enzyme required for sulfatase activity
MTVRASIACAVLMSWVASAPAQVGANYCPAVPNTTGTPAWISAQGRAAPPFHGLQLTCRSLPPHSLGYFLCSDTRAFVPQPTGNVGNLCLGGAIGRYVGGAIVDAGAAGLVSVTADLTALPQPSGAVGVTAGEAWRFQYWYRDPNAVGGATSNFSNALEVTFSAGASLPVLVPIPPGTFVMGSNLPYAPPYWNEQASSPAHVVTLTAPFWMGKYEVTQREYESLLGGNPSYSQGPSRPVEHVTWNDARAYCVALTEYLAGQLPPGYEYRLPTEAEWEYACRAGTATEFHTGQQLQCSEARFVRDVGPPVIECMNPWGTAPVGSYAANAFGLHDMHGNVWEWCLDSFAGYSFSAVTDPFVTGGSYRMKRGGDAGLPSFKCRSAYRFWQAPDEVEAFYLMTGFRVVLAPVLVP